MQLDRLESVKHPDLVKDDLVCEFCADLTVDPVQCQGKCRSVYCRKCATEWCQARRGDATCPKKCMKKWKFGLVPKRPVEMVCPFSKQCLVPYAEDLQRHMIECPFQPIEELLKQERKSKFLCDRDHRLEFMDKLPREMTDPICMDCGATENVKSLCKRCGALYCNKCRLPQYTQKGCPANHRYKLEIAENIRCNICGLAAAYVNLPTHQDVQCKFNICELCFRRLPRASEEQMSLCKKGHTFEKLPKLTEGKCNGCERTTPCWKECDKCGELACFRCERFEVRLLESSLPAEVLFERKECNECNRQSPVILFDKENCLEICYECSGKPRKKAPVFCQKKHRLVYAKNKHLQEKCFGCSAMRKCRLLCKQCKPQAVYCADCKPCDLRTTCYMGHPYSKGSNSVLRECFVCRKYRRTLDCNECNLNICEECSRQSASRPKVVSEPQQQVRRLLHETSLPRVLQPMVVPRISSEGPPPPNQ